jgi:hypothetical protein
MNSISNSSKNRTVGIAASTLLAGLVAISVLATIGPSLAYAVPVNACFGVGASYLGSSGQMGDHASSFPTPRDGIGNVAAQAGVSVGQLGAILLSDFTNGAVTCP